MRHKVFVLRELQEPLPIYALEHNELDTLQKRVHPVYVRLRAGGNGMDGDAGWMSKSAIFQYFQLSSVHASADDCGVVRIRMCPVHYPVLMHNK